MSTSLRRLTRCAVLTALALALSVAEGLVPLTILFPLPGLRLGLANLVTVYALCRLSGREALLILVARCLLGSLLGGNLMALAFSLTGGLLALAVMALLLRLSCLSLFGVSIAGAAAHNTGQPNPTQHPPALLGPLLPIPQFFNEPHFVLCLCGRGINPTRQAPRLGRMLFPLPSCSGSGCKLITAGLPAALCLSAI